MNKIMLTLAAAMTMSFAACAQNKGDSNMQTENKPLVVYFSATGTDSGRYRRHSVRDCPATILYL